MNRAKGEPILRPASHPDLEAVHAINQASVPHVNSLSLEALTELGIRSAYFRLIDANGQVAAFLLAFGPGADYASENYRWFSKRYSDFLYIDRIAVAKPYRGTGLGLRLYRDIERYSAAPMLACEVNLNPPNVRSRAFHSHYGFREVGRQQIEGGAKTVSLMVKAIENSAAPANSSE